MLLSATPAGAAVSTVVEVKRINAAATAAKRLQQHDCGRLYQDSGRFTICNEGSQRTDDEEAGHRRGGDSPGRRITTATARCQPAGDDAAATLNSIAHTTAAAAPTIGQWWEI